MKQMTASVLATGGRGFRSARVQLCVRLQRAAALPAPAFQRGFAAIVAHVETGLRQEEAMMEALDDARLHGRRAEHAVLLCALHRVLPRVERGEVELGRQVLRALADLLALPGPAPAAAPPGSRTPSPRLLS